MEVIQKLKGHASAVCAVACYGSILASGSEVCCSLGLDLAQSNDLKCKRLLFHVREQDGVLCTHNLETQQSVACIPLSATVPSCASVPVTDAEAPPSLLPCEDDEGAVASVAFCPCGPEHIVYTAVGNTACMVDLRAPAGPHQTYSYCKVCG